MNVLTPVIVWLNAAANAVGERLLAPIAWVPGWLSATAVAALTGVLVLVIFKYASNQRAIKRVRDDINANLLALKLFKDSARVTVRAQGRLLLGAGRLLVLGLLPSVVMAVPVTLILGQLSLWYQQRPLRVGEEAVVTVKLSGGAGSPLPLVSLRPSGTVETTEGPIRVLSEREICWTVKARESGYHRLVFSVEGRDADKELAVGDGYMRVSARRPDWAWSQALEHPAERPFPPDSPVRSIDVSYPARASWVSGTNWWLAFWAAVSLAVAFCFRGVLRVNV